MENTKLVETGVKHTEQDFDSRIVIDIKEDSFSLMHTNNLDVLQIYVVLTAALEHLETLVEDLTPPKFLN